MIELIKKIPFSWICCAFFFIAMMLGVFKNLSLESDINKLKVNYANEKQQIAEAHREELQKQTQLNSELTYQLIDKQNQITEQLQQIESVIDDAIKNDGVTYNGIGADSLCLYKRSFGYSCQ